MAMLVYGRLIMCATTIAVQKPPTTNIHPSINAWLGVNAISKLLLCGSKSLLL